MRKRAVLCCLGLAVVGGVLLLPAPSAWAVPSFARAYGLSCSACHSAWPALTAQGRKFKENGYTLERGQPKDPLKITDELTLPRTFPLALVVKARPFDQKKGGAKKLRALHELEIFLAGNAFNHGTYFGEFELEDEDDFEFKTAVGVLGYHPHPLLNIVGGKGSVFHADPYDSLADMRRLTRNSRQALTQGFSTKVPLADEHQMVSLYGRETAWNKLFYSLTYSADVDDNEGGGPKDVSARLALDIFPDLTIGGFLYTGRQNQTSGGVTKKLNFSRAGIDAQVQLLGDLNLLGAYLRGKDDIFAGGDERNNAWYVETFYTIKKDTLHDLGIPLFMVVPLVRLDSYEKNGRDKFNDLTLNLGFYPWQNVKLFVEYFTSLERPAGVATDWRWTVQLAVGF